MADSKISSLTAASAALAADELAINEAGTSKKLTVDQLQQYLYVASEYAPGTFTIATGQFLVMTKNLILTSTQRATLVGTARLRIT